MRHGLWKLLRELNQQGTFLSATLSCRKPNNYAKDRIIDHGDIIENTYMKSLVHSLDMNIIVLEMENHSIPSRTLSDYKTLTDDYTHGSGDQLGSIH